ncbi:DUF6879 family protein [Tenggerimyces flavus]|uniref:DUF6879 family protein n=1 Tax=Tenggerimyces flavus TaxID=1708749 RepID=A0ABV7YN25_9ACTN|nr:DUF6879 family protein [Tenggerimyces flavus]MBM7784904.1 hypothetical protein [Tenggerimyces flavus]
MKLSDLFDSFERSAFRLEALDAYDVPQDTERLAQFLAGEPMSPRTVETSPWLQRVQKTVAEGRSMSRVHAVSRPLTDYIRYELASYAGNVAAGEHVLIADRGQHDDGLADLSDDFWLFDDATVALMRYDADGTFLGAEDDTDRLVHYRAIRDRAVAAAVPYKHFMESEGLLAR